MIRFASFTSSNTELNVTFDQLKLRYTLLNVCLFDGDKTLKLATLKPLPLVLGLRNIIIEPIFELVFIKEFHPGNTTVSTELLNFLVIY